MEKIQIRNIQSFVQVGKNFLSVYIHSMLKHKNNSLYEALKK